MALHHSDTEQPPLRFRLPKFVELPIGCVFMVESHLHPSDKEDLVKISPVSAAILRDKKDWNKHIQPAFFEIASDERVIIPGLEII